MHCPACVPSGPRVACSPCLASLQGPFISALSLRVYCQIWCFEDPGLL